MEQNVPSRFNHSSNPLFASVAFWLVLTGAGLVVIQSLSFHVNLFEYAYSGRDLESGAQVVGMLTWMALCAAGWLRARRGGSARRADGGQVEPTLGGADDPTLTADARNRAIAIAPLIGVLLMWALHACGVSLGFVEIPIWLGLVSLTAVRLAGTGASFESLTETPSENPTAAPAARGAGAGTPIESSVSVRGAWVLIVTLTLLAAVVWTVSLNAMWCGGLLGYWDVGIFANRLVNTWTWTYPFREHASAGPFWDHFNPLLYLLTPLVAVLAPIPLLNAVQSIGLASVALAWAWAVRKAGAGAMLAFALAWLLHPSISQMTLGLTYGFHAVTLAMPLFAASLVLVRLKRWRWFVVCAVSACLFRETVAIGYVGVALWMLSVRELRRPGAMLIVAAVAYFLLATLVVIPACSGAAQYVGESKFSHLGGSMFDVMLSPIRRPAAVLETIFSWHSLMFAATFFALLGFLPLLVGGRRLLMLLPEGVFLLLCEEPRIRSVCFHYQSIVLVQAFWIVVDAALTNGRLPRFLFAGVSQLRTSGARAIRPTASALPVTCAVGALLLGRWPMSRPTLAVDHVQHRPAAMAAVATWASGEPRVVATTRAAAHCIGAPHLYTYAADFLAAPGPTLAILDYGEDWVRARPVSGMLELWRYQRELVANGYLPACRFGEVVAYRRGRPAGAAIELAVDALPAEAVRADAVQLVPGIDVLGWRLVGGRKPGVRETILLELYLRPVRAIERRLGWMVELRSLRDAEDVMGVCYYAPAGGLVKPTDEWVAGEITCDPRGLHVRKDARIYSVEFGLVVYPVDLDTGEAFEPVVVVPAR